LLKDLQRKHGSARFSEVIITPSVQTPDDTSWDSLKVFKPDQKHVAQKRIVTLDRYDQTNFTFDILRTKILKTLRQNNWTTVAITSPKPGCGKTLIALNLAFSFANLRDCRTVLTDLDLRHPQVGRALGIDKSHSIGQLLTGNSTLEETFVRCGDNLAIGANWHPITYAAELLQSPDTPRVLFDIKNRLNPDVMLFDLPPMLVNDDVLSFIPNVDCTILVTAAESSTVAEIDVCERSLKNETNFLGVVLNKCYYGIEKYGY
jgi:Mrp family chromosome partitioning ATPase